MGILESIFNGLVGAAALLVWGIILIVVIAVIILLLVKFRNRLQKNSLKSKLVSIILKTLKKFK